MTYTEQVELLGLVNELESAGQHREAIALCERAIDGSDIPEFNLALTRNHYALAVSGNEIHAWPALLAALDGIAKRCEQQPDVLHAIGICRWVLDRFADPLRIDTLGFAHRHSKQFPGQNWWEAPPPSAVPDIGEPPLADFVKVEQLLNAGHHVRGANALLTSAPPIIRHGADAEGVQREARYLLATLIAPFDPKKVAALLSPEELPPPGDHDGQLYDRYLLTAARLHRERLRARSEGVPGIVITSLPKSASEFLSYTLAETLKVPVMRVAVGYPLLGAVHSKWVSSILQGGAVTHDHFAGTEVNLAALREGGLGEICVLIRDPRAASWSYERMQTEYDGVSTAARQDRERLLHQVKQFGDWIATWVRAKEAGFSVRFVFFRELTETPEPVMGRVLQTCGAARFIPALQEVLQLREEQGRVSSNFRKGDDDAWRAEVSEEFHPAIWDAIDPCVKQLLALKP